VAPFPCGQERGPLGGRDVPEVLRLHLPHLGSLPQTRGRYTPLGGVVTGPAATESAKLTALEQAPGVVPVWSWSRDRAANPLS
jgi:hypothetical protein